MKKFVNLLGMKGKDRVTGVKGVITSVAFDLYGCIQVILDPRSKDGTKGENSQWYDVARIKISDKKRVMSLPDFESDSNVAQGKKGPAHKPIK